MYKIHQHPLVTEAKRKAEDADEVAREAAQKIRTLKQAESSVFGKFTRGFSTRDSLQEIRDKREEAEEEAKRLRAEADRLKDKIADAEVQAAEEFSKEVGQRIRALTPKYLDALAEAAPHLEQLIEAGRELDAIYAQIGNARTISLRRHGVAVKTPFENPTLSAALPISADQFTRALEKCLQTEDIHA